MWELFHLGNNSPCWVWQHSHWKERRWQAMYVCLLSWVYIGHEGGASFSSFEIRDYPIPVLEDYAHGKACRSKRIFSFLKRMHSPPFWFALNNLWIVFWKLTQTTGGCKQPHSIMSHSLFWKRIGIVVVFWLYVNGFQIVHSQAPPHDQWSAWPLDMSWDFVSWMISLSMGADAAPSPQLLWPLKITH